MFTLFDGMEPEQEQIGDVIRDVSVHCDNCRLSLLHPHNRGFIHRGNPNARLAVVYEAPGGAETERGVAMVGAHGRTFERWMRFLGLNSNTDMFITSVIQCQPPLERKGQEQIQRAPDRTEVSACFGPRCLRVLRAMPNLECVMCLGWEAAAALLGPGSDGKDPKAKSHDAQWFETSYLPGIPVFCLADPVWAITPMPTPDKKAAIERALNFFQKEFLQGTQITELARAARTDREEKGLGLL